MCQKYTGPEADVDAFWGVAPHPPHQLPPASGATIFRQLFAINTGVPTDQPITYQPHTLRKAHLHHATYSYNVAAGHVASLRLHFRLTVPA